jgi:hypothetical protein
MKCTVKNPPKNRAQTTFEGQKVPQNKQIANRTKAKKGAKMDPKNEHTKIPDQFHPKSTKNPVNVK